MSWDFGEKLLPVVRYYSYIEITRRAHQTLWREYEHLQSTFDNFAMQHIRDQMIFTRYSANCFISKVPPAIIKRPLSAEASASADYITLYHDRDILQWFIPPLR